MKNLSDIMKDAPPIYARHFTLDELRQLIAFYKSPVGAKAMRELPQVMAEFVATITPRGAQADVRLDCNGTILLARVTSKSVERLALAPGRAVHAVVKSVSFERS